MPRSQPSDDAGDGDSSDIDYGGRGEETGDTIFQGSSGRMESLTMVPMVAITVTVF